jgi:hypothetical protein
VIKDFDNRFRIFKTSYKFKISAPISPHIPPLSLAVYQNPKSLWSKSYVTVQYVYTYHIRVNK